MILRHNWKLCPTFLCFRLLNSEIGNDHWATETVSEKCDGFRLLNSEIGNDPIIDPVHEKVRPFSFRLLNSEIGNDPSSNSIVIPSSVGFRLLNSEIGNDLKPDR